MSDCLFCKIIEGEIPSSKVYEDEHVLAFLDINPVKAGHTLVIPKAHGADLTESSEKDLRRVMTVVKQIAPTIKSVVKADGFNVTSNIGTAAGQSVFHTHLHIIPRYEGDGLAAWPHDGATDEERTALAEKLCGKIKRTSNTCCKRGENKCSL